MNADSSGAIGNITGVSEEKFLHLNHITGKSTASST